MGSPYKKFNLSLNRKSDSESESGSPRKRLKVIELTKEDEIIAKSRCNFKIACEEVSYRNYFDYRARFLLVYLPLCTNFTCKHHDTPKDDKTKIPPQCTPHYIEEIFMIEIRNNAWYEALEVCRGCLTPDHYLSSDILKTIMTIILNVHKDDYAEYTVKHIIDNCQQILMQNFSTHPPCLNKALRDNYKSFLISPLENPSIKNHHKYNIGIVKYCMDRLEYELSADSKNEPLMDKIENIPEELKETLKGVYWLKEKEHFKSLHRQERIERLFAVLETVVELLQFDLAAQTRYTNNHGRRTRIEKLMDCVLQCEDNTGAITENCRQIIRIFTCLIHLQYPEPMVKTFVVWLNTTIQTIYSREIDSNFDYPNTSRYCKLLTDELYKSMSDKPHDTIIRILERIEPTFMRHLVGLRYVNKVLSTDVACIIRIIINFITESGWKSYPSDDAEIVLSRKLFCSSKSVNENMNTIMEKCIQTPSKDVNKDHFAMMSTKTEITNTKLSINHVIHLLYITLDAYLDAYDVESIYAKWTNLNKNIMDIQTASPDYNNVNYSVTSSFVKNYINILNATTELIILFSDLNKRKELPKKMKIFDNIGILKLYNQSATWHKYE